MTRVQVLIALSFVSCLVTGCGGAVRPLWHEVTLPSGKVLKVTSFHLVWGVEHDDRDVSKDAFALEYVATDPRGDTAGRETEAREVFDALVRSASERWGLPTASVAAFPTIERKGRYDLYLFRRQSDGGWSFTRTEAKVFATD